MPGLTVEELFQKALKLEASEFAQLLSEEDHERACDALWALRHYYAGNESGEERLKAVVTEVEKKVDPELFKALLPLSVIPKGKTDLSSELKRRINTRSRKWDTYDVKEEEAEGFCKLWAFLLHELNTGDVDEIVRFVQSCVGVYSLFPHRCIDLVLSVSEYLLSFEEPGAHSQTCTNTGKVLKLLGVDVQELIGFRYLQHNEEKTVLPAWVKNSHVRTLLKESQGIDISFYDRTPASLHKLAGHLIHEGLLFYTDLLPYLQPSLEVLQKEAEEYITKKLAVVSALSNLDKKGLDNDFYSTSKPACYRHCDHYGVILGIVHAGGHSIAANLLSDFAPLQPMTYPPLANGVAAELTKAAASIVAKIDSVKEAKMLTEGAEAAILQCLESMESLASLAVQLGHKLSTHMKLFSMWIVILQFCCEHGEGMEKAKLAPADEDEDVAFVDNAENKDASQDETKSIAQRTQQLIVTYGTHCFLPALCVMTGSERTDKKEAELYAMVDAAPPTMSHGVWSLFEYLPFRHRFQLYENINALLATDDVELRWASAKLAEATSRALRRLTTDNSGELAKSLAKLSFSSPIVLFTSIFRHVMNFGTEFIPHAIDAMKQFPPLALDVMTYKMISLMSDESKTRMKPDKVNLDDWLSNLGHFVAQFFKKQAVKYDVTPMLEYVLWRARLGKSTELTVLKSMLNAAGIESSEDLSDIQLEALELNSYARTECISLYDTTADSSKSALKQQTRLSKMLRTVMKDSGIAHQTLLALASIHSRCVFDHDVTMEMGKGEGVNLRMMKAEHSRISTSFIQTLQFIIHVIIPSEKTRLAQLSKTGQEKHLSLEASAKLLPFNVIHLVETYGIAPPLAHAMCGPRIIEKPLLLKDDEASIRNIYGIDADADVAEVLQSKLLPTPFKDCLGLYVAFWSLNLQDIADAQKLYKIISDSIAKKEADEERKSEKVRDKSLLNTLTKTRATIEAEEKQQANSAKATQTRLRQNSKQLLAPFLDWAADEKENEAHDALLTGFFQTCIWPRAMLSGENAIFSARFVRNIGQIGFPVNQAYLFFCRAIPRCLASCTTIESQRIALFLRQLFSDWFEAVENKQCTKELFAQGHAVLARGLLRFFNKGEPIHEQKLAFEVLRTLEKVFPMHEAICSKIEDAVRPLQEVCYFLFLLS